MVEGLIEWMTGWAQSPSGETALFLLAFAESSFFPIPPDVLLIAMAMLRPELAFKLALICALGSVLGGMFGYGIGLVGGRPLLHKLFSQSKIQTVKRAFEKYEIWAIAVAGFTPVPYKVFTLSAGVFSINFPVFLMASVISRGLRFFVVAGLFFWFGPPISRFIDRYFNLLTWVFGALLILGFLVIEFVF